mmetsp:Transcript_16784/g.37120  ORF Transcript_16784/g.37120 Transcript_16784/m.37120 type:complete len:80 (+) Transcript_16784:19-258(+)
MSADGELQQQWKDAVEGPHTGDPMFMVWFIVAAHVLIVSLAFMYWLYHFLLGMKRTPLPTYVERTASGVRDVMQEKKGS